MWNMKMWRFLPAAVKKKWWRKKGSSWAFCGWQKVTITRFKIIKNITPCSSATGCKLKLTGYRGSCHRGGRYQGWNARSGGHGGRAAEEEKDQREITEIARGCWREGAGIDLCWFNNSVWQMDWEALSKTGKVIRVKIQSRELWSSWRQRRQLSQKQKKLLGNGNKLNSECKAEDSSQRQASEDDREWISVLLF